MSVSYWEIFGSPPVLKIKLLMWFRCLCVVFNMFESNHLQMHGHTHRQYKKWTEPSHSNSIETSEARFWLGFFLALPFLTCRLKPTQAELDDVDVT